MENIWYCFERSTGEFAGSGTPHIDNETHGSTLVPCPSYIQGGPLPVWNGSEWMTNNGAE